MLDVIRRVISGEMMSQMGEDENPNASNNSNDEDVGMVLDDEDPSTMTPSTNPGRPALVENDMEAETQRSSVSDMSGSHREEAGFPPSPSASRPVAKLPHQPTSNNTNSSQGLASESPRGTKNIHFGRSDSRMTERSWEGGSQASSRDWGWFEDVHVAAGGGMFLPGAPSDKKPGTKQAAGAPQKPHSSTPPVPPTNDSHAVVRDPQSDAAAMAVTAPTYVLEESLSSQKLWKHTAGQRPPQPVEERAFFEKMWTQNFARSQVEYRMPVEVLTATTPISMSPFADGNFDSRGGGNELSNYNLAAQSSNEAESGTSHVVESALMRGMQDTAKVVPNDTDRNGKSINSGGENLKLIIKGDNVFGTTVSKSFSRTAEKGGPIVAVDTVNISIASYRVVESKKRGKFAQFLVIYREGSIRDTIGVWKRYSDFQELSRKVNQTNEGCAAVIANISPLAITEEHEVEHLPNAITSWKLLKKRQRWYRCLDAGYLSLKVFLLERFLHDILFESSSPDLLREFVTSSSED
eukprot:Nitzschia sp. Nitz4//scaffold168_size48592//12954//14978//NITZ4_007047-RA/size48592-augustus-gene-0.19-mRNA-1//1//CDS//3329538312//8196//frame0